MAKGKDGIYRCNFCDKSQRHVKKMISGGPPGYYAICNECLEVCMEIMMEENFELSGFHLTPKDLVKAMGFHPVFTGTKFESREDSCFYVGPFSEPFNSIYKDHIAPVFEKHGIEIRRADDIYSTGVIMEDVWVGINSASMVIAEMTGRNPNVMYEVGLAHTVGKPVLMISQAAGDLPFDLRHRRCVIYNYTPPGCRDLETGISKTIEYLRRNKADEPA